MIHARKVVWHEGMFIAPHHFQQSDRYYESLVHFRFQAMAGYDWGMTALEIDHEALKNGVFTLRRCAGVMPGGLAVAIPEQDEVPPSRSFEEFYHKSPGKLEVFLAIPEEHAGAVNCSLGNSPATHETRYAGERARVRDENTGENEREIVKAAKRFKIVFTGESLNGYVHLKLAEVVQNPARAFVLSEKYIFPCLAISASTRLATIVQDLCNILVEKHRALSERRRQKTANMIEFGAMDIMVFWLLHTVNSFIPLLQHARQQEKIHPENLYSVMAQLAGALCTFSVDVHPHDLPAYSHANLSSTFETLLLAIRQLLEVVLPTKCVAIPLEPTLESWLLGRISDGRLFEKAHFYLAVRAEVPEDQLMRDIPKNIKIGALDRIALLVRKASPGVRILHEPRPPAPIPTRAGYQYFRLESQGGYWDEIRNTMTLAIYFPDDLPGLKAELLAVWE